jgi:hypothetical protein
MVIPEAANRQDLYCPRDARSYRTRVIVNPSSPPLVRYSAALGIMGGFLLIRLLVQPWLGWSVPYLQFFPAIILTAYIVA